MQTVSNKWIDEHKKVILNESFVEVSLDIADPESLAVASSRDNGAIYISNSGNVVYEPDTPAPPYCTLEQNLWCLDGNREAIPEIALEDSGYVSDVLSDDTCVFSTKFPIITIEFPQVFTTLIPGITITWGEIYGEFADTFEVIAYNGDAIVARKEVTQNRSVKSLIFVDIANYNRIDIVIKKWCLPNHRARVWEIFVGAHKVYGKTELFDYSHSQSVDPVSLSLPKSEIKFSVDNSSGEYNPYNTSGLARFLTERQEIKARYGLKLDDGTIEWIKGGTFYLSEWNAKQNGLTADFTARDLFESLSDIFYDKDFDNSPTTISIQGRTLKQLVELLFTAANLPSSKWKIDDSLEDIQCRAPLPNDSIANCLQLIANASMCTLYVDREGVINLTPLSEEIKTPEYRIDSFNSYSKSEVTLSKPIKQIVVKGYSYLGSKNNKDIKSETVDVVIDVGSVGETITLDNPLITFEINEEAITPDEQYTYIHAKRVGEWLATHLSQRMTINSTWRADVRLDPLDIVTNTNEYNTSKVRMTNVEYRYNGAFRATGEGKVIGNG